MGYLPETSSAPWALCRDHFLKHLSPLHTATLGLADSQTSPWLLAAGGFSGRGHMPRAAFLSRPLCKPQPHPCPAPAATGFLAATLATESLQAVPRGGFGSADIGTLAVAAWEPRAGLGSHPGRAWSRRRSWDDGLQDCNREGRGDRGSCSGNPVWVLQNKREIGWGTLQNPGSPGVTRSPPQG